MGHLQLLRRWIPSFEETGRAGLGGKREIRRERWDLYQAEASGQRFHDGALVCLSARLSEHWTLSDQNASTVHLYLPACMYMYCMCEHQLLHVQALATKCLFPNT